ncbi:MAG: hypothetical protein GJ680_19165 [Alteromonadaceae bacterium]|nr:hypothetical protein [Alteromonadaceae bacterium]
MKRILTILLVCFCVNLTGCASLQNMLERVTVFTSSPKTESQKVVAALKAISTAHDAINNGELADAKRSLDKALMLYPDQAPLHLAYARYYELIDNQRLAALAKQRASHMTFRAEALNKKGLTALEHYDNSRLAKDFFQLAIRYDPTNINATTNLGLASLADHDTQTAQYALSTLRRLGHDSPTVVIMTMRLAQITGDNAMFAAASQQLSERYQPKG